MSVLLEKIADKIPSATFTDTALCTAINGTADSRYGLVKRAIRSGHVIHLRRGLYAFAKKYRPASLNLYEIAGKLYGPSYVSLEAALSYHGWIPEAVYTVTNVCAKRSKEFNTPLGMFSFAHIPCDRFFAGVKRVASPNGIFLMATPFRALADYVYVHHKRWRGLKPVIESLRVDESNFRHADFRLLEEVRKASRNANVKKFIYSIQKELLR